MQPDTNILSFPDVRHHNVYNFTDLETAPFDTVAYSKMKFGSQIAARKFGYEMADTFFSEFCESLRDRDTVIIPAPSTMVPVASTMLSRHFLYRLNDRLHRVGMSSVEWTMIHRKMTYCNNYADLGKEDRVRLLSQDPIYLNTDFIRDKLIVFIDDVRITGTHENKLRNFLRTEGLDNPVIFSTLVTYHGADPKIEGVLNHVSVKNAHHVIDIAQKEKHIFEFTTRGIRLFLECSSGEFPELLDRCSRELIEKAYNAAILKDYSNHPPYRENWILLAARYYSYD
jgi:hypothetical protein